MSEILDVINDKDEIIDQKSREEVHKKGLLHRTVWIWFFNDTAEVIVQKRSNNIELYPGLIVASATGHVSAGESYQEAAVKEINEELGLSIERKKLILLGQQRTNLINPSTGFYENSLRKVFALRYNDKIDKLKFCKDEVESLLLWPIDKILNSSKELQKQFVPELPEYQMFDCIKKLKNILIKS